jgi:hypothetical protein
VFPHPFPQSAVFLIRRSDAAQALRAHLVSPSRFGQKDIRSEIKWSVWMSALGYWRTLAMHHRMSALTPKADITDLPTHLMEHSGATR